MPAGHTQRQQTPRDRREEFCLALLFRYPLARSEGELLDAELFAHSENRALFESWVGWANAGEPFDESLTPDLRPQYERVFNLDLPAYDDDTAIKALRSTVWGIEQQRLRYAKRASGAVVADIAASTPRKSPNGRATHGPLVARQLNTPPKMRLTPPRPSSMTWKPD